MSLNWLDWLKKRVNYVLLKTRIFLVFDYWGTSYQCTLPHKDSLINYFLLYSEGLQVITAHYHIKTL